MMDHVESTTRDLYREHLGTLDVLHYAKDVFFWLALLAVALHVMCWIVVGYTDTLAPLAPTTLSPDSGGRGSAMPTEEQLSSARRWQAAVRAALALGGFVGRASTLVMAGILTIALLVSLSARLGGAADLARACVWSLVALAMLVPWLRAPDEVAGISSALGGMDDLTRASTTGGGGLLSAVRFLLCPLLVGAFLVLAQINYRHAHRRITAAPGTRLPIREV